MVQLLASLSPKQRALRYRQFAAAAFSKAEEAKTQAMRAEYISMASGWHSLAAELERSIRSVDLTTEKAAKHTKREPR